MRNEGEIVNKKSMGEKSKEVYDFIKIKRESKTKKSKKDKKEIEYAKEKKVRQEKGLEMKVILKKKTGEVNGSENKGKYQESEC